ncbi:AMP-binding protein [Dactylosporangium roseum]|uniref:AMP-binding protein n=1 Tax=Dactylosporangium roseum TaxID=47989 RepID=A0ABY5YZY4_9ACTN|nr:AMP-binding protein [Dactylosporangium roseum]UWZ34408.1 AMP-binding protein [Dactylosporangium roseum]
MLSALLEAAAAIDADREVLRDHTGPVTLAGLLRRAASGASRLAGSDACLFLGVNGPAVPMTLFACCAAAVPFVPLNYRLTDAALAELVARFERPMVIADPEQAHRLRADVDTTGWLDLLATATGAEAPAGRADGDEVAVILFTSGTTAAPKAVPLRHANLASYVLNSVELVGAAPDEVSLVSVPPYHVAGVGSALTNPLSGRRLAYLPRFDPGEWLATCRREGVTSAMVVPTMLARILGHLDGRDPEVPTLRHLAYGGARMSPETIRAALAAFPHTGMTNAYGLTETSSTLTLLTPEDHRAAVRSPDGSVARRLGSVGRPLPGVEFQVRGPDGTVLPADVPGELWVRGPQVSGEYVGQGTALDAEGWFNTRDGGFLDADGYVFVQGRLDDTIIRGGENIAPAEVEDVLTAHPAVRDAAVLGLPDPEWGERIVAAVIARAGAVSAAELIDWCRARLRSSRTPDEVVFVDELPYSPTGKLVRRDLAAALTRTSSRS